MRRGGGALIGELAPKLIDAARAPGLIVGLNFRGVFIPTYVPVCGQQPL